MTKSMCINAQLVVFKIVIGTKWQTVTLDDRPKPNSKVDTDKDGLTDWEEILTTSPLVTWNAVSDYVTFPTVANIIAHVGLTDGIGRIPREFMDKLSVRVMPIRSNPEVKDSDGDGIWDDFDPQPLSKFVSRYSTIIDKGKSFVGADKRFEIHTTINTLLGDVLSIWTVNSDGGVEYSFEINNFTTLFFQGKSLDISIEIFKVAKAINPKFLTDRSVGGIENEMILHWLFYNPIVKEISYETWEAAKEANMGGSDTDDQFTSYEVLNIALVIARFAICPTSTVLDYRRLIK